MLSKLQNLKWPGKDKAQSKSAPASPTGNDKAASTTTQKSNPASEAVEAVNLQERLSSPKEKVRAAACLELKDSEQLLQISQNDQSNDIKLIAARQFARLTPADDTTRETIDNYATSAETKHLAKLITAHNSDADVRKHGLKHFTTDADYLDIAVETRFHDTRQVVARKIQSLEIVDKCWRQLKSKDKIVARELKQRLAEQHDKDEKQRTQQEEVTKISDEMQKLAHGAWSPTFAHRYELFANRWNNLEFTPTDDQQKSYEAARTIAAAKAQENLDTQKQFDDCENIVVSLEALSGTINNTTIESLSGVLSTTKEQSGTLNSQWQAIVSTAETTSHPIDKSHQQRLSRVQNSINKEISDASSTLKAYRQLTEADGSTKDDPKKHLKVLEDLQSRLSDSTEKPAYTSELGQLIQTAQKKVTDQTKETQDLKNAVKKQFGSLNSAIAANRWGPAKSIHERLTKKVARLGGHDKKHFAEQLQRLEIKLNELGDWKQFATEPKLESLCEAMEKVPSLGLTMKDQADRIKDLQSQWKSMGASPAQESHWPRFKTAADTAYEPCAKYFAAKRTEKDNKLAQRAEICDMLQTYLDKSDWETPDSKLVEKTIRTAKNEWRNTRVFDRKAGAKLEERFTKILAELNQKLEPAYEAGVAEKTDLIEKVKAMAEGEINQHSINQLKRYQAMWRVTSTTKRADDQKLWTEFNEACSAIYNTHRSKQREQYAASVEHVTRAKQIIGELKSLRNTPAALDEKTVQQLQDEFQALAEFPERDQKYLFRDFNRAVEGLEQHRQKITDSAQAQEIQRLRNNAILCDHLEALAGNAPDIITADIERLLAEWDDGEKTDKAQWRKAINLRKDSIVTHLKAGTQPDYDTNTSTRRLLCIENEILHEAETPTEDKQLRMEYQLKKLQEGMSSATAASQKDQSAALEIRWLTSFPAEPDLSDKLNTRFNSAQQK